jgi:ribosomal protein S3
VVEPPVGVPVAVNIEEVRKPEDRKLIAGNITQQLKSGSCSAVP